MPPSGTQRVTPRVQTVSNGSGGFRLNSTMRGCPRVQARRWEAEKRIGKWRLRAVKLRATVLCVRAFGRGNPAEPFEPGNRGGKSSSGESRPNGKTPLLDLIAVASKVLCHQAVHDLKPGYPRAELVGHGYFHHLPIVNRFHKAISLFQINANGVQARGLAGHHA